MLELMKLSLVYITTICVCITTERVTYLHVHVAAFCMHMISHTKPNNASTVSIGDLMFG